MENLDVRHDARRRRKLPRKTRRFPRPVQRRADNALNTRTLRRRARRRTTGDTSSADAEWHGRPTCTLWYPSTVKNTKPSETIPSSTPATGTLKTYLSKSPSTGHSLSEQKRTSFCVSEYENGKRTDDRWKISVGGYKTWVDLQTNRQCFPFNSTNGDNDVSVLVTGQGTDPFLEIAKRNCQLGTFLYSATFETSIFNYPFLRHPKCSISSVFDKDKEQTLKSFKFTTMSDSDLHSIIDA